MAYALGVRAPGGGYVEVAGGGYARSDDGRFPAATATWGVIRAYGEAGEDGVAWEPLGAATLVRAGDRPALDTTAGALATAPAGDTSGPRVALTARKSPTLRG